MTMSIKGSGGSILIEVLGYERPTESGGSDANWVNCRVDLSVIPFRGQYNASFTTQDFVDFHKELDAIVCGTISKAAFIGDEQSLSFEIEIGARGAAVVTGEACLLGQPKVAVKFSFETDQSYLQGSLKELAEVIKQYPVR